MSQLNLFLFGPPRVEWDGRPVDLHRRKVIATLIYLAVTRQRHRRDTLATLFWPEADQATARASLRRELYTLNSILGNTWLDADRESLGLAADTTVWVDVEQFQQCLRACQHHDHPTAARCDACLEALTAAVALYRGDFLAGFTLSDCPAFDDWQFFQAESLRRDLADALTKLVHLHKQRGAYEAAIDAARRWLLLDPLHEPVHRELMQLYALAGQTAAAVRQYHECQRVLDEELGVEPESVTTALMEAIRTRRFPDTVHEKRAAAQAAVKGKRSDVPLPRDAVAHAPAQSQPLGDASVVTGARHHNLPAQTTPFVGRENELLIILDRLQDPACRLLTLVGPGGIGKTRLALQAAQLLIDRQPATNAFANGIYFVPLTAVSTPRGVVVAIAEALNLSLANMPSLQQQLLTHLGTQQVLLVLDNYEQLLAPDVQSESTALITDLLAVAPALKVLLTTREALNVREEWFHQVGGLAFPREKTTTRVTTAEDSASYDAVRFFEQCAQRVQHNFSLVDKEVQVVRFCRLIEGMPLAIELATAWLKVLTVEQIVEELAQSLDILTTRHQNVPARHRSMRLVLEQSWALLDDDEQKILKRLAILRGGFRQAAAAQIAGASLPLLARLTEKALIRMDTDGRYQMHELLRQFAEEKLSADEQMAQAAQAQHSRYYLDFLRARRAGIENGDEPRVLAEVAEESENVRLAWQRAVVAQDLMAIESASKLIWRNLWVQGRAQEGEALFTYAVNHLHRPETPPAQTQFDRVLIHLQQSRGAFYYFLGDYATAAMLLEEALLLSRRRALHKDTASTLAILGAMAGWQGKLALAQSHLEQALALSRADNDHNRAADLLHELARLQIYNGDYPAAQRLVDESLAIGQQLERADWIGYALATMGWIAFCLGDYTTARQQYAESLDSFRRIDHQLGLSLAIGGLSWVTWATQEPSLEAAFTLAEQSLAICRRIDHRLNLAHRLGALAQITHDLNDYGRAQQYAEEGIAVAAQVGAPSFLSLNLACLAESAYSVADLAKSRTYMRRSLQVATAAQLEPRMAIALFHYAVLLQKEAGQAAPHTPAALQKQGQALTILTLVARHPACWHIFQTKAAQRVAQLEAAVAADVVAMAQAQAATQSLAAVAESVLLGPVDQSSDHPELLSHLSNLPMK